MNRSYHRAIRPSEPLFTDKDIQKAIYGDLLDLDEYMDGPSREKQFIIEVLLSEDCHRWNAFCMGKHHRLGKDSPVQILPNDVFKVIRKHHRLGKYTRRAIHRAELDSVRSSAREDTRRAIRPSDSSRDNTDMVDYDSVEDILMIIEQTKCSVQTATKVYFETNCNVIESILLLYTWWF